MEEITFIIHPDGTVEETVSGIQGQACEAVTQAFERALGRVDERKRTTDWYADDGVADPLHLSG